MFFGAGLHVLGVYLVSGAKAFDGATGVLGSLVREVSSELKGKGLGVETS